MTPSSNKRQFPNILITGTPGTGKTTTAEMLMALLGEDPLSGPLHTHIDLPKFIKTHALHAPDRDETWDTLVFDEDQVVDALEPLFAQSEDGGVLVDSHSSDFFPQAWFDLVVVLTAETAPLYDRLVARGYSAQKVEENMSCEIMMECVLEAQASYPPECVVVLPSNTVENMESNVERIAAWIDAFIADGKV